MNALSTILKVSKLVLHTGEVLFTATPSTILEVSKLILHTGVVTTCLRAVPQVPLRYTAPNPGWAGGRKRFGCGLILLATDQAKVCLVKVLRYSPKRNQAIHIPTIMLQVSGAGSRCGSPTVGISFFSWKRCA